QLTRTKRSNFAKTLRLTSDQLKTIGLLPGANIVKFTVGKASCISRIFLWNYYDMIVISDIDGTITKSDALGHIFNMVGKDWTHPGVAKLYTDIQKNGYKLMYLTSRAIGQADSTREYLKGIDQNQYQLPDGPVIMSPDRLFQSLHREVVLRKPHLFKMACLKDILSLFGNNQTAFYAGFGNRITDALSYRSVHVPVSRIFTIDYNGDIQHELIIGYNSSYIKLTDLVDQIFPPTDNTFNTDYNDWNYWKNDLQELDLDFLDDPIKKEDSKLTKTTNNSNNDLLLQIEGDDDDEELDFEDEEEEEDI
ncbi:LNS2-domain-containing protein, partial [Neoconidiobolus thromboides FSU 785]